MADRLAGAPPEQKERSLLEAVEPASGLDGAIRLQRAGMCGVESAVGHMALAGRTTCGRAASCWARRRLVQFLEELDDEIDAIVDQLLVEARRHEEGLTR